MVEDLQKPAKLEFRIVNVDSNAPPPQTGEEWTDDEGIPYEAMLARMQNPMNEPYG